MMKHAPWMVALVMIAGACLGGAVNSMAASSKEAAEAKAMMKSAETEQRAATAARKKDPAWKPSFVEVGLLQIGDSKNPGALKTFCLNGEGNILACLTPNETGTTSPSQTKNAQGLRVYSPKGQLMNSLPLEIKPGAICVAKDGSIFVAGDGRMLKLDATGKVLSNGDILAAESGPPTCIKRFSASGKFLGLIAVLNEESECVRVTVEASPDGKRFYLLDTKRDAIRVFSAKN